MGNRVDEPKSSLGLEKIIRQRGRGRERGRERGKGRRGGRKGAFSMSTNGIQSNLSEIGHKFKKGLSGVNRQKSGSLGLMRECTSLPHPHPSPQETSILSIY